MPREVLPIWYILYCSINGSDVILTNHITTPKQKDKKTNEANESNQMTKID